MFKDLESSARAQKCQKIALKALWRVTLLTAGEENTWVSRFLECERKSLGLAEIKGKDGDGLSG